MTARDRGTAPARGRRTHAERTAETRKRVIAAVVESIAQVGYQRTTASEIARRAGVTWGAVQHHFGDKEGILIAVLEDSFERFARIVGEMPDDDSDLEKRVARFIDRSWEHFGSPHYRSTFEILLNLPADLDYPWQEQLLEAWFRVWSSYFPESRPRQRGSAELVHYTIAVLSGLAATRILERRNLDLPNRELGYLKHTLVRELGR